MDADAEGVEPSARIRHALAVLTGAAALCLVFAAASPAASGGPVVAVIDSGVDAAHPPAALWTNPAEVAGNARDDDGDGIVDDVQGADLGAGRGEATDDLGHGTEMAGIVRARAGGAVIVMPLKVLGAGAVASPDAVAGALRYAVAHGARIALISLNSPQDSPALAQAVHWATRNGLLIVTSAGNEGINLDLAPSYPAAYPDPGVIAVTSVGRDGALSPFSNRGRRVVDVAARGEDVVTTGLGGRTVTDSGTSQAAAGVAGVLAGLLAAHPDWSADALRASLLGGALRNRGVLDRVAYGEIDLAATRARAASARAGAVRLAALRARRHGRRVVLRWQATGQANRIVRFRVRLGRRHLEVTAGRSGRLAWRLRARSAAGRVSVSGLDYAGHQLARMTARIARTAG